MPAIVADQSLRGGHIVCRGAPWAAMSEAAHRAGCGAGVLDKWAYGQGVSVEFSRPGKPADNPFIESSTARSAMHALRAWVLPLDGARRKIESRRCDYNHFRQHSYLGNAAPAQFAEMFRASPSVPISLLWDG